MGHLETGRRTVTAEHAAAGRRVGSSLAGELERRVVELRHLDDVLGGNDLFPLVHKELADARTIVRVGSHAEATRRRLLVVVGELAQPVGWVASDAGRYGEARAAYLSGVSAAREAGDRPLTGQLLSSLSYQLANVGNPADALLLARSAVAGAGGATPVVSALLLERVAWAAARARDADGARRALDAVDEQRAGVSLLARPCGNRRDGRAVPDRAGCARGAANRVGSTRLDLRLRFVERLAGQRG